jgi:predicted O-methyltransferase YrrM
MAQSYPKTTVVGIDVDGPSIEAAKAAAATAGVSERVEFLHADGTGRGKSDF